MINFKVAGSFDHRRHHIEGPSKDWDTFFVACLDDEPNWPAIEIWNAMQDTWRYDEDGDKVRWRWQFWIVSGRSDAVKDDYTPDDQLKERWMDEECAWGRILVAFDDSSRIVKMWRSHGVPCFQVAEGDF